MDTLCEETTALNIINNNVETNSESNFNYEQLELLSESKPEQMFLSLINNFKHILYICVDVTVMINVTNLFSKIKLLKSSELKRTVLNMFHNTKYLEHLNNHLKDVASTKDTEDITGNKLQEFFNNCKIVLEHVVNPESEELLNEIIQSIQSIESNNLAKHNLEIENITQILNYYRSDKCVKYIRQFSQCYDPIPFYPEISDFKSTTIILSPNIIKGRYKNVSHYVNVQFHLLREDFLSLLRNSIQCYKALKQYTPIVKRIPNVQVYNSVRMTKIINNECLYFANFQTEEDCSSNSSTFMFGSLLVFSDDEFNSMFFGTVIKINRNESPSKSLKFQLLNKNLPVKTNSLYTMFEYNTYFLPYMYAMKALRTFDNTNFPMMSYILNGKTVPDMPVYMRNKSLIYNNNGLKFNILNDDFGPDNKLLGFDSSQCMAFKAALTKQLCIIQGPPGTGKTYIGLRIVKTIIENMYITNILKNPIMIISSKNDVLDQFLESLINITDKIVRIGGRCNSNILKSKILRSIESPSALEHLKNSYVIGLTITEASKRHITLLNAFCPIVIVEEAADVLEPYLVASLTKYCQHLILIGDHKQLRPRTASNILAKRFKFDVSLFERMVKNKFPCYTLNTQHRMRPTISALMKPIYPYLKNHRLVRNRSDIFGVTKNVYFINHENREEKSEFDGQSYKNIHEVNFLMEFTKYLLKQGYYQNQITILVAYREQLLEFQKIQEASLSLEDLQIQCIDSYQGKENDIILLSLVRNNIDNNIGFLSTPNRVCVALSRARNGLYIMGNMENLMHSLLWNKINKILVDGNFIGNKLTLCCKIHKDCIYTVCDSNDFIKAQCSRVCNIKMDCGHQCLNLCHHYNDQSHTTIYRCEQLYTRLLLCGIEIKMQCETKYLSNEYLN